MKMIELRHPFFRPLWRRVAVVVFTAAWAVFELLNQSVGWAILMAAITAYCIFEFFIAFDAANFEDPKDD